MNDDAALLRRYAEERSEAAYAELVRRHLDLVYSAALRRLAGDAHGAADVAQQVFTTLAREAEKLSRHGVLTAWLYTATRNAAIDLMRSEQRRRTREQEAFTMQTSLTASPDPDWEKLRPVLDEVMDELPDADRTAVLLRFFDRRPFAEVGAALQLSEDAARMRVERALEKLRTQLSRRGVTSTSGALAAAFAHQAVLAAPAGLATSVVGAALATTGGVVASGFALTSMSASKITAAVSALLLLATLGMTFRQSSASGTGDTVTSSTREENSSLAAKVLELKRQADAVASETALLKQAVAGLGNPTTRDAAIPGAAGGRGGGGGRGGALGSSDTSTPEAYDAGREFTAKYPEVARRALESGQREGFDRSFASQRYASLKLSPEEYEAVYREYVRGWPWELRFSSGTGWTMRAPNSQTTGQIGIELDPFVRALVGEERFKQKVNNLPPDDTSALVQALAGSTYDLDAPLSPQQTEAVVTILEKYSARRYGILRLDGQEWTTLRPQLEQILSAEQLMRFELLVASGEWRVRRFR